MIRNVRAAVLLVMSLGIVACDSGPAAPLAFEVRTGAAPIAGAWRGIYEVRSCTGDRCFGDERGMRDFALSLVPAGDGVTGVLTLDDAQGLPIIVNLRAGAGVDGVYAFSVTPHVLADHDTTETIAVDGLELVLDPAVGLRGAFRSIQTNQSGEHIDVTRRTAEVRSAVAHASPSVSSGHFNGRWQGYFVGRSCTGTCHFEGAGGLDYPRSGRIEFSLAQAGSTVTGLVYYLPISGTVTGTTLVANGAPLSAEPCVDCWDCGAYCGASIRQISLRIDKTDVLSGTMEYSRKGVWRDEQFTQTVQLELNGVTRVQ